MINDTESDLQFDEDKGLDIVIGKVRSTKQVFLFFFEIN
jgi:hypothetical protein